MKYIRTEDGRIAKIKENMFVRVCDDATRLVYKDSPYSCVLPGDDDILKQADTIEELCDCFIKIKRKNNCKDYILKFDYKDLEELKKQFIKFPQSPVYGAIHIDDKGIIYKAKMKGILPDGKIEWELL